MSLKKIRIETGRNVFSVDPAEYLVVGKYIQGLNPVMAVNNYTGK